MSLKTQHVADPTSASAAIVALVGNPNTGKTTLFNELTGYRQRVGNYPGVTVEKKTGRLAVAERGDRPVLVIDLPGAYGFSARSHDEMVVIDTLTGRGTGGRPDLVVAVVDAVNLRRNLFLTSQLLELGIPVVIALNMVDLAESRNIRIDARALEQALGVPVVPVVATRGQGIEQLKQLVVQSIGADPPSSYPQMPDEIVREIEDLRGVFGSAQTGSGDPPLSHVELLQVLLEPEGFGEKRLADGPGGQHRVEELSIRRNRLADAGLNPAHIEAEVRYRWIEGVIERAVDAGGARVNSRSDMADRVATHPVFGPMLLILIMGVVFQSIYAWAAPVMDGIEALCTAAGAQVAARTTEGALQSLLVNGVVGGVGAVLVFLPQIMILFLFLAILEDCGYLSRAAFLLDRFMALCGLNGKAFLPLVSSFACAVPGIMTTRTIEHRADRFVTILVAPLMSCSARLPVYVLLIAAFIPARPLLGGVVGLQTLVLIAMYMVGIAVAIVAAWFLRRVVFRGATRAFLMELPSYKCPSPKTVLYRVYERAREFVIRAGTIIFAVSIVIWALGYYPRPTAIGIQFEQRRAEVEAQHEFAALDTEEGDDALVRLEAGRDAELRRIDSDESGAYLRQSVLGRVGRAVEPVVEPLGWDWKIGTAVLASFPAREVVISTLGTIYNLSEDADGGFGDLRHAMQAATWPDGRQVYSVPVALSIMVFFALCMQCGATLAVIKRETNSWRWPALSFASMTLLAYVAAFVTFRVSGMFV